MRRPPITVLVFLLACLAGCGSPSPREAAEGYLGALAQLDFDRASQFVADEGRANFEFLKRLYVGLEPEEQRKFQVNDWRVIEERITGDSATIDFVFDGAKKGQLSLQKIRGAWKVSHRQTF